MERAAWWDTVHGVAKSQTQLTDLAHMHTHTLTHSYTSALVTPPHTSTHFSSHIYSHRLTQALIHIHVCTYTQTHTPAYIHTHNPSHSHPLRLTHFHTTTHAHTYSFIPMHVSSHMHTLTGTHMHAQSHPPHRPSHKHSHIFYTHIHPPTPSFKLSFVLCTVVCGCVQYSTRQTIQYTQQKHTLLCPSLETSLPGDRKHRV